MHFLSSNRWFLFFSFILSRVSWPQVNSLKVLPRILTSDPKEPLKYEANSIIRELHLSYGVLRLVLASPKPSLPTLLVQTKKTEAEELKARANGRNIIGQQLPTLLDVTCCVRLQILLHVVGCCCAKFETGQTFQPTTPNISFVP